MPSKLILSVVDQSPVRAGGTAGDALSETIDLAVAVEALGYQRYWVAEHHSIANFAGTSPEIMTGAGPRKKYGANAGEFDAD